MTAFPAPAAQAPWIVPGSLVRVNPAAETRFAGRSGLLVALDGDIALVRFSAQRAFSFATCDLLPVVRFDRGAGTPWRAPAPKTSPAGTPVGASSARGRAPSRTLRAGQAGSGAPRSRCQVPSPALGSVARHGGRAGDGHDPNERKDLT